MLLCEDDEVPLGFLRVTRQLTVLPRGLHARDTSPCPRRSFVFHFQPKIRLLKYFEDELDLL